MDSGVVLAPKVALSQGAEARVLALVQLLGLPLDTCGSVGALLRYEVLFDRLLAFSELEGPDAVVLALEVAAEVLLGHVVATLAAGELVRGVRLWFFGGLIILLFKTNYSLNLIIFKFVISGSASVLMIAAFCVDVCCLPPEGL